MLVHPRPKIECVKNVHVTPLGDGFLLNDTLREGISRNKSIFLKSSSRGKAHLYGDLSRVNPNIFLGVQNPNPIRTTLSSNKGGPKETTHNIKQLPKRRESYIMNLKRRLFQIRREIENFTKQKVIPSVEGVARHSQSS